MQPSAGDKPDRMQSQEKHNPIYYAQVKTDYESTWYALTLFLHCVNQCQLCGAYILLCPLQDRNRFIGDTERWHSHSKPITISISADLKIMQYNNLPYTNAIVNF